MGKDSYAAYKSELFVARSVALTVTRYRNEVMTWIFSMTPISIINDTFAADSVIITNGIFENIPMTGF